MAREHTAAGGGRPIPRLDRGMPVEVMRDFDTVLLFGRLEEINPAELVVQRVPGEERFPVVETGSAVLVRCYDERMDPVLLWARVARSSGLECAVGELTPISYQSDRKWTRIPLCPSAEVRVWEAARDQSQPCQLLNLSAGGACVVAEGTYPVGQTLCLQIRPDAASECAPYPCRVVRATPRRGGCFEYGLLFVHLSERQRGCLAQEIQMIQEETGKKLLF